MDLLVHPYLVLGCLLPLDSTDNAINHITKIEAILIRVLEGNGVLEKKLALVFKYPVKEHVEQVNFNVTWKLHLLLGQCLAVAVHCRTFSFMRRLFTLAQNFWSSPALSREAPEPLWPLWYAAFSNWSG
jgi:hypothetical protein